MITKKFKFIGIIVVALFMTILIQTTVKAATLNPPLYFGVTEEKMTDTPNLGYAIGNPKVNGETPTAAKLWEIVKYSSATFTDPTRVNVYCIKAGVGFSDVNKTATYNISFDMKKDRTQIAAQNDVLRGLINNGQYDNLLALADLLYIRGISTDAEKTALLEAAGIYNDAWTGWLTGDEIEAVQQAAIWYFTNFGENNGLYNKYDNTGWLWYTEDNGATYQNFSGYNPTSVPPNESVGKQRQEQAELLYKYLIDTAKTNGPKYADGTAKSLTKLTMYASTMNNQEQPLMVIERNPGEFDLALRKNIIKIDNTNVVDTRVPSIDETSLETGTTATYKHRKEPLVVKTGSVVTYNLTIYNEGNIDGRATKIVDQLPIGLKFKKINTTGFDPAYDESTNTLTITRGATNKTNLTAYEKGKLSSETIEIECEVMATPDKTNQKILTNVAWIAEDYNDKGITDRDSKPSEHPSVNKDSMENYKGNTLNKAELNDPTYYYKGEQDDDDFEKLVILPENKEFDLKLIKRITKVNDQAVAERIENVDITKLADGTATTADYKLNKQPISVKQGDLVTYTFRVYNEGDIDGYAKELTEDLPEGLQFLGSTIDEDMNEITDKKILDAVNFNASMGWTYATVDGKTMIKTDYLAKGKGQELVTDGVNLIKAFDKTKPYSETNPKNPDYREVSVILKVIAENTTDGTIRNEAAITNSSDTNGDPIEDRDSKVDVWKKYEDDEDYDLIQLKEFDLALRKFTVAISKDEKIDENKYLKDKDGKYVREPQVDVSKLNTKTEDGKRITTATYNHTKEPLLVQKNNIVVYMLRVYNEGDLDGYAGEIKDYLPTHLEFVKGEFNDKYKWEASEDGRIVTTNYLNDSLVKKFDGEKLDYVEVPIMCKVKETATKKENITNIAEITEYLDENKKEITDRDSEANNVNIPEDSKLPGYKSDEKGTYIPGQEDDDDFEKLIIKEFNLALRKWVTEAIVIENGKETIIQSGHTPEMEPEPPLKVELHRKKVDKVVVKFRFSIRVYNVGDIDGYAKEVKDYLPEGLKFVVEDNKQWTQIKEDEVVTTALANTLLKPGEYADVSILLTWKNSQDNMGLKTNTAEISKDDNEYDLPDINSVPNNKKPGEDDIDDAPVLLTVSTGQERIYFTLGFTILITVAGGLIIIKKYVL